MRKAGAAYVLTILEIMEDKAPFMIARWCYCIMIMVVFHQDAGYFFSTYERTALSEPKAAFVAHLNEISPGTFLLYYKGNDQLTLIVFVIMQILSYSYFTYVGVLMYLKKKSSGKRKLHSFLKKYKDTKSGERSQSQSYLQSSKSASQTNENKLDDSETNETESDKHNNQSKLVKGINQILNVFFTFYYWVFFTPFVEINSGVFVCGGNSFLLQYRDNADLCDGKPLLLRIFPVIGLSLTLITGFIVVYLFRSYEFHDQNLLKRRFYTSLFFQLLCRFFLIFCYYLNISVSLVTKHILASCLGVLAVYDSVSSISFSDKTVALFFGCAATVFEISVVLCHLWIFTNDMPAEEFFYYFVILSCVISGAVVQTMKNKMEGAMRMNPNNYSRLYKNTDFYLEEFVRMILEGRKDEYCKFKLEEVIIFHQLECNDPTCYCHSQDMKVLHEKQLLSGNPSRTTTTFTTLFPDKSEKYSQKADYFSAKGSKTKITEQANTKRSQSQNKKPNFVQNMLSEKDLKDRAFKIVDSIFKWALASPQLQHDTSEFEHLSLKYISYLAKYRQNTFRAYYELKALLFGRSGVSFYFKMISKIMSRSIETQIKQEEMMNHSKDEKDDLPVWVVWKMDSLKDRFVPAIARALESKNEFWRGLQNGFIKMEDCVEFCEKQSTILRSLNQAFESELNELDSQVKHTFVYFKILSIFELLIRSQPTPAAKYDKICHELIKRDITISANGLNNSSIANKQIATIMISFSKNPGNIISKIPNSLRTIFKFTKGDALALRNVNQLMPKIIGSVHNELLMNSNNRGAPSPYVGTTKASSKNILSFCVDKQGYLFAVKTFIGNTFGHADDFCFVGSVLKVQNNLEYMLFNQTGQIQGISQLLFKRLFQSKNTAFTMTLSELLKSGYAFLFCQSILQSIREDIDSEILGDQLASGILRRASINVTSNFGAVFKRFQNFLEIKKPQPNILDYSAMKQLLNEFSRMKLRRSTSHNSSHYKNSNQNITHNDAHLHAWWIGLTYSLRYQEIKYHEGTKSIQLFHLAVQDISEETQDNPKSVNQSQDASQTEFDFSNTKTSFKISQTTLTEGEFSIGEFAAATAAQNQDSPGLQQKEVQRYRDRLLKGQREDENNSIQKQSPRQHTIESLSQNARINQKTITQGLIHRGSSTRDMSDSRALSFIHELIGNEQSKTNVIGVVMNNNDNLDIEGGVADPAGIESSLKNSMGQSIHRKYEKIGGQSSSASSGLVDSKMKITGGMVTQNDLLTQAQLIQANNNNNSQNTNNFTTNNFFQTNQINTEDEQEYQQQQQQIPLFDYIHETQLDNQIAQNPEAMQSNNASTAGFFQTDRDANYSAPTTRRDGQQADESDRIVNAVFDTEVKQQEIKEFTGNNENYIYNVESLINNQENEEEQRMKRIDFPIRNNEADIQEINGFPAVNNPNAEEQKILRNALNSSNSMKSKSMDFANTQNIQRLKQGKGQNLEDQGSIGSHQSRASRTGQEFIKDILNRNNLPIAAKMYLQVMGLIVVILLGSVLWSAIFISMEIKGLSGDLDQLVAYSDIDVAFKRCLVGGIKANVARLYASTDSATSTEELAIATADIAAAVGVFSKYLQQLQAEFEGYSVDVAMYDSEYLKQTMLLSQNGFVLLELSNEEVLKMSYNSDFSVVSSAVRSFLFFSQNYFTFSEVTQQLRLADSSRITSDLDTIDMMTYISAIVSTLLCIGVALAGYPLVARISNYKEKIVLLVSRISAVEIDTEIEKQKECINQLTSSEETFLTDDFFEIVYERKRRRIVGLDGNVSPRRAKYEIQIKQSENDQIIHTQQQQQQEQLDNNGNNNNKSGQQQQQLQQGWQNELSLAKKDQSEVNLTQDSNIKERSNQFKDAYESQPNRDNNLPSSYRLQSNSLLVAFPKKKVDFKVNLSSQGQQQPQQQQQQIELQSFSAARLPQQQLQELSEMQSNSPQNMLFRSPTYSQSQQLDRQEPQGAVINKLVANKFSKFSLESPQILPAQQPQSHRLPRTTRGQSQSSLGGISINTGSTNIPGKHHKTTRKPNSSNYVSSRITEQKLSIAREYIIIGISGFLSAVFFCSLMAYTLLSRSSITTSLSLVFNTLSARSAITGYFTDSDILGGYDYLLAANSMVLSEKQLTRSMVFAHLGLQMKELTEYSSETSEIILKLSSNDYSSILQQLFESDLCTGFASCSSSQFSYCQTPSNCGDYTTGISGIISQSLDVYSSYASTLSSLTSPANSDAIDYMHSAKHMKSISEGFLTPDQVFSLFAQISISAASNIVDKIANVRIIVYSVVGPMLLSMVAGIFYYHWKSLKRTLLSLNYLLVVIPSDKLSEEITLHVLKAIKAA